MRKRKEVKESKKNCKRSSTVRVHSYIASTDENLFFFFQLPVLSCRFEHGVRLYPILLANTAIESGRTSAATIWNFKVGEFHLCLVDDVQYEDYRHQDQEIRNAISTLLTRALFLLRSRRSLLFVYQLYS